MKLRYRVWRWLPRGPRLEPAYELLLKTALAGLNFGSVGGVDQAAEIVPLERLRVDVRRPVVFDVGAHLGQYAEFVLEVLPQALVHCFEPNPAAYGQLAARMGSRAEIHPHGISDARGKLPFFSDSSASSSASIHPQPPEAWHAGAFRQRGAVNVVRLDDFCQEKGIETIDFLKLDIEGHELRALRGAERLLANGSIRSIQFEFGPPALAAHATLADFFNVLSPAYEVARLVPGGAVPVRYNVRHEIYVGVNYLATLRH